MPKPTDVRPIASELYFLPVQTRVPLKFGKVDQGLDASPDSFKLLSRV